MAKVRIEAVLENLDSDMKKALDDTMREYAPNVRYNSGDLFRFFLKRVYQPCSTWESVPDSCVEKT
jgi:hypothetical protein